MRCLIFGAGAVGGYLGAKLLEAGWPVTFLGREAFCSQLKSDGLRLIEGASQVKLRQLEAIHQWPPSSISPPEIILITVKAYDCQQAADQIRQLDQKVPVVSFVNGIGSEAILREGLPAGWPVVAATLTTAVEHPAPGEIRVTKTRGLGLQAGSPAANQLSAAFERAGVEVARYSDWQSMKWSKLLSNLIGNASAALTGLTVAEIYAHPGLFRLEIEALREAVRVMKIQGHSPRNLPGVPTRWLAASLRLPALVLQPLLRQAVAGGRGGKRPSMYYDVTRGQTEVDWLNGAVVSAGQNYGVATPANKVFLGLVQQLVGDQRLAAEAVVARAAAAGVAGLAGYNRTGNSLDRID